MKLLKFGSLVAFAGLVACASVEFTQLGPDGIHPLPGAASGLRVPMFRPYILVAAAPQAVTPQTPQAPGAAKPANNQNNSNQGNQSTTKQANSGAAPSNTGDTSFQITTPTYVLKLVYLPDYSHMTAVTMSTGLFGTASLQLALQNGMLTSVSANGDNTKLADVLTSVLQAATGASTGGASTAATKAASASKALTTAPGAAPSPATDAILAPGLYAFEYSDSSGRPTGICALSYFDSNGSHPTPAGDPGTCPPDVPRPGIGSNAASPHN